MLAMTVTKDCSTYSRHCEVVEIFNPNGLIFHFLIRNTNFAKKAKIGYASGIKKASFFCIPLSLH